MNKKIVFTIIGLGIFFAAFASFLILHQIKQNQAAQQNPATLTIETTQGNVTVNNFTANPVKHLGNTDVIEQTKQYSIVAFPSEGAFTVTLLSNPLSAARIAAEQALLKDLNISQQDACKLNVTVAVPESVSAQYSGKNFGLSFCLNGRQIQ